MVKSIVKIKLGITLKEGEALVLGNQLMLNHVDYDNLLEYLDGMNLKVKVLGKKA